MVTGNVCEWFDACPLKKYYEQGKLDEKWIKEYCLRNNPECKRKKMEEKGIYHPDNMLPDGTLDRALT